MAPIEGVAGRISLDAHHASGRQDADDLVRLQRPVPDGGFAQDQEINPGLQTLIAIPRRDPFRRIGDEFHGVQTELPAQKIIE